MLEPLLEGGEGPGGKFTQKQWDKMLSWNNGEGTLTLSGLNFKDRALFLLTGLPLRLRKCKLGKFEIRCLPTVRVSARHQHSQPQCIC